MALNWPESPKILHTRVTRLDGLGKATGTIKYPSDVRPEGMLFGVMLYSPYAHAKIKSIDTSAAEKLPGVKAIHVLAGAGKTLRFHGDDIAAVAAETEEQARDAVRAIKVEYEVLPHAAIEEVAAKADAPRVAGGPSNVRGGRAQTRGNPDDAIAKADAIVKDVVYSAPVITHVCLEAHGSTVKNDGKKIEAWSSTQNVGGVGSELAQRFELPQSDVEVHTEVMGGGFGSKFGAEVWGITAAELSKKAGGRPVRMFLDRVQEHLAGGNRPSVTGKVTIAGKKDGTITAIIADCFGTGGVGGGANVIIPYVYSVANVKVTNSEVMTNAGAARAMRAPRHPQSCLVTEAAVDDLADKLGLDPLEVRLKNLAERDMVAGGVNRTEMYREQAAMGAELIGWKENWKPRGQNGKGPIKRGLGVAFHQWGGGGGPGKQVSCTINPDGSVEMKTATQDIGTGIRTVLAMIAAEELGLKVTDITSSIGNSKYPPGQPSGGSTTTPTMAPPALDAVTKARDALFKKIAPAVGGTPETMKLANGMLLVEDSPKMTWKDACRKLGMTPISVTGDFQPGLSSSGVGGVQFADVIVDVETGVVKLKKIVAVQDSGLILDLLTWESQVYGGIIGGLNYALFEERVLDPTTGIMLNPDMELYKLAGASDIPEIVVKPYDTPAMRARGVIGIGEPPTIGTAAAIGNAVSNAIGVRVPRWPMTPKNVLDALAQA